MVQPGRRCSLRLADRLPFFEDRQHGRMDRLRSRDRNAGLYVLARTLSRMEHAQKRLTQGRKTESGSFLVPHSGCTFSLVPSLLGAASDLEIHLTRKKRRDFSCQPLRRMKSLRFFQPLPAGSST